jgi:hypothetical protein
MLSRMFKWAGSAFVLSLAACAHPPATPPAAAEPGEPACAAADLEQTLASAPSAQVIVLLHETQDAPAQQAQLLQELGAEFQLARSYQQLPGFAGTITRQGYALARTHHAVRCVQLDHPGSGG